MADEEPVLQTGDYSWATADTVQRLVHKDTRFKLQVTADTVLTTGTMYYFCGEYPDTMTWHAHLKDLECGPNLCGRSLLDASVITWGNLKDVIVDEESIMQEMTRVCSCYRSITLHGKRFQRFCLERDSSDVPTWNIPFETQAIRGITASVYMSASMQVTDLLQRICHDGFVRGERELR